MITIILQHKNYYDPPILYSYYHLWEHIFVGILTEKMSQYEVRILGEASKDRTILIIDGKNLETNFVSDKELDSVVYNFKTFIPKIEDVENELQILDSELSGLATLYHKNFPLFTTVLDFDFMKFMEFKQNQYNWSEVDIEKTVIKQSCNKNEKPQNLFANYRQNIIKAFLNKDDTIVRVPLSKKSDIYTIELLVIEINDSNHLIPYLKQLDDSNNFFDVLKKNRGLSYIFWPSFSKDKKYWFVVMCVKKSMLSEIVDLIYGQLQVDCVKNNKKNISKDAITIWELKEIKR